MSASIAIRRTLTTALRAGLLAGAVGALSAQTTWTGTSGLWSDAANWSAGVPGATVEATISNGGTAGLTSGSASAGSLFLGASGDAGALVVAGGSLTVSDLLGIGHFAAGSVTVANAGSLLRVEAEDGLLLATSILGSGTLTVQNFGVVETHAIREGNPGGSAGVGTVILSGGFLRALSDEADFLKNFETGDVRLEGLGGVIDTNGHSIGIATGMTGAGGLFKTGAGVLSVTGSSSYAGGTTVSAGTLRLEGSDVRVIHSGAATVVGASSGDNGLLQIAGGEMSNQVGVLGDTAGSRGTAEVTGGLWHTDSFLTVGRSGTGTLMVGTSTVSAGAVVLGGSAGGAGQVTLSANGVLLTGGVSEGSGTGTVDFQGGILRATGDSSDFLSGFETGDVTIGVSGAVVDTNGFNVTVAAPLDGPGILFKRSSGTLTLTGSNSHAGNTVAAGTLRVGNPHALGSSTGDLFVSNGAALDLYGNSVSVGNLAGGGSITSGTAGAVEFTVNQTSVGAFAGEIGDGAGTVSLIKSGTGSLTFSGSQGYTGPTVIQEGGLIFSTGAVLAMPAADLTVGGVGGKTTALTITGGRLNTQAGILGGVPGALATATITSGSWSIGSGLYVGGFGAGTSGTLNVSGGLIAAAGDGVFVGYGLGTTGQMVLNSTGRLGATQVTEGLGSGTLEFHGGTLLALADSTDFLTGFEAGDLIVGTEGAFFDTNGFDVTVSAPLTGDGVFFKQGIGTLTLSGSNAYSGGTTVGGGALRIGSVHALGTDPAVVTLVSGTLDLNDFAVEVGQLAGGSGARITNSGTTRGQITVSQSGSTTYGGSFVPGTAGMTLVKSGSGTLQLTGSSANLEVIVNSGTLGLSGGLAALSSANEQIVVGSGPGTNGTLLIGPGVPVASRSGTIGLAFASLGSMQVDGIWSVQSDTSSKITVGQFGSGTLAVGATGMIETRALALGAGFSGMGTVTLGTGALVEATTVTIGDLGVGTLVVGPGAMMSDGSVAPNARGRADLGVQFGGRGTAWVNGGTWNTGQMAIGVAGEGTLQITGGGKVVNGTLTGTSATLNDVSLGVSAGSKGTATVTSGTWVTGNLIAGVNGSGTLTVNAGGLVSNVVEVGSGYVSGTLTIGQNAGAQGGVVVNGGVVEAGAIEVGRNGVGALEVTAGGLVVAGKSLGSGAFDALGLGIIGSGSGSVGSVLVHGGTWVSDALSVGQYGSGTLAISGGGRASVEMLQIGGRPSGTGAVSVSGGTLEVGDTLAVGGEGNGSLTVQSGGLVTSGFLNFVGLGTGFEGQVTVDGGTWNTTGNVLVGWGGEGSLSIRNGGNVSIGGLNVDNGMLRLTDGGVLTTGTAGLKDNYLFVSSTWNSTGALLFTGTSSLRIGVGSLLTADGTLSAPSLELVDGGRLTTNGTGVFQGSATVTSSTWNNSGVIAVQGDVTVGNGAAILSSGTLMTQGTLRIAPGGLVEMVGGGAGALELTGGRLENSGVFSVNGGADLSGTSRWISGGIAVVLGDITVGNGAAILSSGTLATQGTLRIAAGGLVETAGGGAGALVLTGGTLSNTAGFSVNGGVDLSGTSAWNSGGILTIVDALSLREGSLLTSTNGANVIGTATITSSTWNSGGQTAVGNLEIGSGGYFNSANGSVTGSVTISGGTWNNASQIFFQGGTERVVKNGGALVVSGTVFAVGTGISVESGGRLTASGAILGELSGSPASLSIDRGTADFAGSLVVGSGTQTILVSGVAGNRGVLAAAQIIGPGSDIGMFSLDGGIVRARANEMDFLFGFVAGDITLGAGGGFFDSNGFSIGISAVLGGTGALTKTGSGSLTLSGSNTYSGGTVVQAGTLIVADIGSGASVLGSGDVTVETGGGLAGVGTVLGNTQVAGTLAPGTSPGTLHFAGNLLLQNTALVQMELASSSSFDALLVDGLLTFDGALHLTLLGGYTPQIGDTFDLFDAASVAGGSQFDTITFTQSGYAGTMDYGTGVLTITAVPEPTAAGLLLAAGCLALRRRRARAATIGT